MAIAANLFLMFFSLAFMFKSIGNSASKFEQIVFSTLSLVCIIIILAGVL